jgi:hypothetical protein
MLPLKVDSKLIHLPEEKKFDSMEREISFYWAHVTVE